MHTGEKHKTSNQNIKILHIQELGTPRLLRCGWQKKVQSRSFLLSEKSGISEQFQCPTPGTTTLQNRARKRFRSPVPSKHGISVEKTKYFHRQVLLPSNVILKIDKNLQNAVRTVVSRTPTGSYNGNNRLTENGRHTASAGEHDFRARCFTQTTKPPVRIRLSARVSTEMTSAGPPRL